MKTKYQLVEFEIVKIDNDINALVALTHWKVRRNIWQWLFKKSIKSHLELFCSRDGKQWRRYLDGEFVENIDLASQLVEAFEPFRADYIELLVPRVHNFEMIAQ